MYIYIYNFIYIYLFIYWADKRSGFLRIGRLAQVAVVDTCLRSIGKPEDFRGMIDGASLRI